MDYGKYKYEAAQKVKESRRNAAHVSVKEMKYRPKIGEADFETKTKKVAKFLGEGHKVKITIMFRGRETQHPELGRKILDEVAEAVEEVGKVETYPRLDGRNMTMVLGPDRKSGSKKRSRSDEGTARPPAPAPQADSAPAATPPAPESPPASTDTTPTAAEQQQ
jgi:translation initiation factor IF-3